ncbi:MAG: DUF192 domain-containing protein [Kiritimatiellae bacterium]|jgi:uncharacterized membrane protein (UPF0127 family)|nr:DUF192 domain-containing protein [Kiritimatiellia bacterium]
MKPEQTDFAGARGYLRLVQGETVLIDRIAVANRFPERARGLMFRNEIPDRVGAGYFFPNCRSLHTCFMRFDLDILFLDAEGQLLKAYRGVKPFRMICGPQKAAHCLEVRGGTFLEGGEECFTWLKTE